MIFSNSSEISPVTTITIDGAPAEYLKIHRIEVEFEENKHDLAVLEFAGMSPETLHLYIEAPIYLRTSVNGSEPFEFYGYIVFLDPKSETLGGLVNGSPLQITKAYCFGASYRMRYKKFKIWENKTIADIAKEIATEHQFSVAVPSDPYVFPRLVQSEESNWSFLVRVSNELGYNVSVSNTHIHVWDPYRTMSRKVSFTRLETLKGSNGDVAGRPGQVLSFEGRIGDVTPEGSRSSDTLFSLDENNNISSVTNKDMLESASMGDPVPSVFTNVMSGNASSYAMAKKRASSAMRRKFPITASAVISAETGARPGGIAYLDSYSAQFDGFWYIKSVRHLITRSSIATALHMAKDALGTLKTVPVPVAPYENPPAPAIVNKAWVASTNKATVYS